MLVASRLVHLDLGHHAHSLGLECTHSLAAGLRQNETLKSIKLPWLNLEFIGVIGEALTSNRSLESIYVYREPGFDYDEINQHLRILPSLEAMEKESLLSFIRMLPRMKSLTCIAGLFDFRSTKPICQALVVALNENTWLKEIIEEVEGNLDKLVDHVCHDKAVQFYLQLNRLGRRHYVAAPENKAVPVGVLPHLFARMTDGPEYTSHLYYFLSHTSPELLAGREAIQRKRRPQAHSS
jgi:hypothetical protein